MDLIVGIPACSRDINGMLQHATPARYGAALIGGAGAMPVLLPPVGEGLTALVDRLDGLLLSGSPSNIEPRNYGVDEDLTPGLHDAPRDATTLPMIRAALAKGVPVLAICRGLQELNVALGGTLIQRVQDVPGRHDHRAAGDGPLPDPIDWDHLYRLKHAVTLSGHMAQMVGAREIRVNSLHQQAIDRPGEGVVVEGVADDGTIEAVHLTNAPGWVMGVQWHPEFAYAANPDSVAIFAAFGQVCRAYAAGIKKAA